MKTPLVRPEVWKPLYKAATRFRSMRPWETLENEELFAMRHPKTGEMGYCCIMGAVGMVYGLSLYRGAAGLDVYRKMQDGEIHPEADDVFALQNALIVDFNDRKDLENEDLDAMKSIQFKAPKDGDIPPYPSFRSMVPAHSPWFLTEDEAQWLTMALEAACDLVEGIMCTNNNPFDEERPGFVWTYTQASKGSSKTLTADWAPLDLPLSEPVPILAVDELLLRRIKTTPLPQDSAWEADFFYIPGSLIMDQDRPYFAQVLMIVQQNSGFILNTNIIESGISPFQRSLDQLLDVIQEHKALPKELHVRNELLWEALKPVMDKLAIRVRLKRTLPRLMDTKMDLIESSMNGFAENEPGDENEVIRF